jgi:hypothetical protein
MLLTSSASPGNQHRVDVRLLSYCVLLRRRAIFCIHFWRLSKSYSKNLSIRGINVARVMRPTGVALPSFLKARQVLAGLGDAFEVS